MGLTTKNEGEKTEQRKQTEDLKFGSEIRQLKLSTMNIRLQEVDRED